MMLKELCNASDAYRRFIQGIKYENRFFVKDEVNDILDRVIEECEYNIIPNTKLYRARIHKNIDKSKKITDYKDKDIGMPSRDIIPTNGRVNPK